MGRNTSGVKAVRFRKGDYAIGMVIASPEWTLLTACENGYGKRTPIGPNGTIEAEKPPMDEDANVEDREPPTVSAEEPDDENDENSNLRYTTKHRGGLGLVNIKTTARNGSVIGICRVRDGDEVMMITARGQIQRFAVTDVRVMGRNTQGVRLMNLDDGDTLVAVKRVPIMAGAKIDGAPGSEVVEEEQPETQS